jgi:hypothetical protein
MAKKPVKPTKIEIRRIKKNEKSRLLIIRFLGGEDYALTLLAALHKGAMTKFNKTYFPFGDTAMNQTSDQVNEISTKLKGGKYTEVGKCDGWIIRLCKNSNLNKINKEKMEKEKIDFVEDMMDYEDIDVNENEEYDEQMIIMVILKKLLSERQLLVVNMTQEGNSPVEIAEFLEVSASYVRGVLLIATNLMKNSLLK